MDFHGRALENDIRWQELIVNFFTALSKSLNCFYAAGYVGRNVIVKRNNIWFDGMSEIYPLTRTKWWLGLYPCPTWLAWFGKEFQQELEKIMIPAGAAVMPDGIFYKCGNEPRDIEQLAKDFPELPLHLLSEPKWKKKYRSIDFDQEEDGHILQK